MTTNIYIYILNYFKVIYKPNSFKQGTFQIYIALTVYFFQWLFQPIQGPGLLFSSVFIFHGR
jgi:hypothetical protein